MQEDRTYEDLRLFRLIAEGDEYAFREIFEHYGAQIHPFVLKTVKDEQQAREVVQEVFLKLWLNRDTLATIEKPASWLFRIASNVCINHFRKQELDKRLLKEIASSQEGATENIDELSAKELRILIKEAVDSLPHRRRQIYHLCREQGLSRREVASQLNISENTVKNQLGISLQAIQDYIRKNSGYYIPVILILWK